MLNNFKNNITKLKRVPIKKGRMKKQNGETFNPFSKAIEDMFCLWPQFRGVHRI
jgi:hypothetical protein